MSALGQLAEQRADKAAAYARGWRHREGKKQKREQQRLEDVAARTLIGWGELREIPQARPDPPAPRTCQWPVGGMRRALVFCGVACVHGRSYCAEHARVAYVSVAAIGGLGAAG